MFRGFSLQAASAGMLSAFVGCASSFAVVLAGLSGIGASPAQAASGLMALSFAMGVSAIMLSLRYRMPISIAWSTPGAALLATSAAVEGGFATAVAAFIISALMIILAGLWRPLGNAVARIPAPLANAMLAGVLLGLCLDDGSFQIFEGQLPLVLTQFLGPFAMHDLVQFGDEVLEALVGFPECITLAQDGQNSVTLVFRNGRQVEG